MHTQPAQEPAQPITAQRPLVTPADKDSDSDSDDSTSSGDEGYDSEDFDDEQDFAENEVKIMQYLKQ